MIIDYISITIAFVIITLFVVAPRSPSILLLIFLLTYFVICWWHLYRLPMKDTYMTSLPNYLANKNIVLNRTIINTDLFITISLFVIVILLTIF